jgi:hypothetical protein
MKFNPITNKLFSDDGGFIKKLHCPFKVEWETLIGNSENSNRRCGICEREIIDTNHLNDTEIQFIILDNPNTCLKLNFNQGNLQIVYKDVLEKK